MSLPRLFLGYTGCCRGSSVPGSRVGACCPPVWRSFEFIAPQTRADGNSSIKKVSLAPLILWAKKKIATFINFLCVLPQYQLPIVVGSRPGRGPFGAIRPREVPANGRPTCGRKCGTLSAGSGLLGAASFRLCQSRRGGQTNKQGADFDEPLCASCKRCEAVALSPAQPVGHPFADLVLLTPDEGFFQHRQKSGAPGRFGIPVTALVPRILRHRSCLDVRMLAAT